MADREPEVNADGDVKLFSEEQVELAKMRGYEVSEDWVILESEFDILTASGVVKDLTDQPLLADDYQEDDYQEE